MNFLGLDLSLCKTGYVVLDDESNIVEKGVIERKPGPLTPRIVSIEEAVIDVLQRRSPVGIAIEDFGIGCSNQYIMGQLAQLHGAIKSHIHVLVSPHPEIKVCFVSPTTAKKFCTSSGRGEKSDMKMSIFKKWDEEFHENNEADAYVLAKIAQYFYHGTKAPEKYENECLKVIRKRMKDGW